MLGKRRNAIDYRDDDDLNPDFTINTELLHRTVFPVSPSISVHR